MIRKNKIYFMVILIMVSLACAVPALPVSQPDTINTTPPTEPVNVSAPTNASTATFTFTPTLIQLTRPNTETPVFTLTIDPNTATPTITPFPTLTIEPVTITVSRPTNCRVGPGRDYEIAGALLAGEEADVLGRDPTNEYWYIPNPDPGIEFCWVWGEYASFTGANLLVPMLTPLPTPTATATALPDIKFNVQGRGSNKCDGDFWIKVEITNTSEETKLTFRSVRVEVEDTDTNTTRFNSSDGFILRDGCNGYIQTETIEYGKSFIVSGPNFPYNLNGHTLRVYVTVCTEKDLKGICRTIKIGMKP